MKKVMLACIMALMLNFTPSCTNTSAYHLNRDIQWLLQQYKDGKITYQLFLLRKQKLQK